MRYLGYYLKAKRNKLFLYQKEAAEKIGVSRIHYCNMETDKVYGYNQKTLKSVCEFLGKPSEWVLKRIPPKIK